MMIRRILNATVGLIVCGTVLLVAAPAQAVFAAPGGGVFNPCSDSSIVDGDSQICAASKSSTTLFGAGGIWNRILNTLTFVIGAVAVLMVLVGAVRYALSAGDQSQVTAAKNTILYAVVALVVAVMANAIVNFVLTNI